MPVLILTSELVEPGDMYRHVDADRDVTTLVAHPQHDAALRLSLLTGLPVWDSKVQASASLAWLNSKIDAAADAAIARVATMHRREDGSP